MQDLKDVTNNVHYENYRCLKLAGVVNSPDPKHFQAPSRYVEASCACIVNTVAVCVCVCLGILLHNLKWRRENMR